jgi:beta-propeller uncharacterized protein DUF5122/Big-like domain-containing protein/F5/8 type C domain-containing protein
LAAVRGPRLDSWLRGLVAIASVVVAQAVLGQTVISPPSSQVHASGYVLALARQTDGKIVVGGQFIAVNGVPRNNLARLNADGSLDTTWNPGVDGTVFALAVDGASIYAGGGFSNVGGMFRRNLVKIPQVGDGTPDPSWDPSPDSLVFALALDGGGNVYAGGGFTTIGGQPRNYLAKLSVSGGGSADAVWNPDPDERVGSLTLAGGAVVTAGAFTTVGGQARQHLAKLDLTSGAADAVWAPAADGNVFALAADGAGNVYVGGDFSHVGGSARPYLAKIPIDGTGAIDGSWAPNVPGAYALATEGSTLYVGGYGLARVSSNGTVDPTWAPAAPDLPFYTLVTDGTGNVTGGGLFSRIGDQTRLGLASFTSPTGALASGGPAEPSWAIGTERVPQVDTIALDPMGRTIIGGAFQFMHDGTRRNNIARLNADGSMDTRWNPNPDGYVSHVVIDGSGNVFVGGFFDVIGSQWRPYLAKIPGNGDGTPDPNWTPEPNDIVWAVEVDSTSVYAGGNFTQIGGQARNYLAKLSIDDAGAADPVWNPNPDGVPWRLTLDGSTLYAGGAFTTIGGQPRTNLARLSTSGVGAVDPVWAPNPDRDVWSIAVDTAGDVFAAGNFFNIGGQARAGLAKLSGTGAGNVDPNWGPDIEGLGVIALSVDGPALYIASWSGLQRVTTAKGAIDRAWHADPDHPASSLRVSPQGDLHVGGTFTQIAEQTRFGYALLEPYVITLASPTNPSAAGDTITFVATLSGSLGSPTGSVTFKSDTLPLVSCVAGVPMPASGPAYCSTNALAAGDHTISVEYTSDPSFGVASTASLVQTVNKLPSSTIVAISVNPASAGAYVTFAATVTGKSVTGSVTFAADGATIAGCGAVPLVSAGDTGTAQCSTAALAIGTRAIAATYSGDSTNAGSMSTVLYEAIDNADGSSVNVALATAGSAASASSTFSSAYPPSAINNGDRAGANFGAGGVWKDATSSVFPDWVQIDFATAQTIDHVIVYSVQDAYAGPVDPSDTLTFTRHGLSAFDVQAWNGTTWMTLGSVTNNNLVKRNVSFGPTTTSKIRVVINAALSLKSGYSLVTEIEAWLVTRPPPATPGTTLASSANPGRVGQNIMFTATVVGTNPTGPVSFTANGTPISGCGSIALTGQGSGRTAACSTSFAAKGTYSVAASYAGDANNPASKSAPVAEVIARKQKQR